MVYLFKYYNTNQRKTTSKLTVGRGEDVPFYDFLHSTGCLYFSKSHALGKQRKVAPMAATGGGRVVEGVGTGKSARIHPTRHTNLPVE